MAIPTEKAICECGNKIYRSMFHPQESWRHVFTIDPDVTPYHYPKPRKDDE